MRSLEKPIAESVDDSDSSEEMELDLFSQEPPKAFRVSDRCVREIMLTALAFAVPSKVLNKENRKLVALGWRGRFRKLERDKGFMQDLELGMGYIRSAGLERIKSISKELLYGIHRKSFNNVDRCAYLLVQNVFIEDEETRKMFIEDVCIAKNIELAENLRKDLLEYTRWLTAREIFQLLMLAKVNSTKRDPHQPLVEGSQQVKAEDFPIVKMLVSSKLYGVLEPEELKSFVDFALKMTVGYRADASCIEELIQGVVETSQGRYADYSDLRNFLPHEQFVKVVLNKLRGAKNYYLSDKDMAVLVRATKNCSAGEIVLLLSHAFAKAASAKKDEAETATKKKVARAPCVELCDFSDSAKDLDFDLFNDENLNFENVLEARSAGFYRRNAKSITSIPENIEKLIRVIKNWGRYNWLLGDDNPFNANRLLYGLPGIGKTYMAEVIASETGLPLRKIRASEVVSKFIGSGEEYFKKLSNKIK